MVRVRLFGSVSMLPGPKVTVPVGLKTPAAGGVTFTVTIMTDGGLTPFFLEPPKVGVVQVMVPPLAGGTTPVQVATPRLSTVTMMELMVRPAGTKLVKTTFGAGVVDTLAMVQTMFPACPRFGLGACGFPVMETGAETTDGAGNGTVVVMLAVAFANAVPAASVPLATTELRSAWFWICTITVMVDVAPAAKEPWLQ